MTAMPLVWHIHDQSYRVRHRRARSLSGWGKHQFNGWRTLVRERTTMPS
ncbi:MAG: hypothetical protein IPN96_09790 [Anaerolineales bacterium]|nr:hypothetical protein [Anaerolineales bacterium]